MPHAMTAQGWAHRGNEFEPELQIHAHCDPRFDARGVKATQVVMEKYGSYAVAAHLSYLVTEFSLEVQFLTREIGEEASALWAKTAGPRVRLGFSGPLSLVPSIGAIKVAEVSGWAPLCRAIFPRGPLVDVFDFGRFVNCVSYNADTGEQTENPT
jgi:hypothetical protein